MLVHKGGQINNVQLITGLRIAEMSQLQNCSVVCTKNVVREPVLGLIMWSKPKGLKMCSYVEKYAEFKNQTLIKIRRYTNKLYAKEYPRIDPYHK